MTDKHIPLNGDGVLNKAKAAMRKSAADALRAEINKNAASQLPPEPVELGKRSDGTVAAVDPSQGRGNPEPKRKPADPLLSMLTNAVSRRRWR